VRFPSLDVFVRHGTCEQGGERNVQAIVEEFAVLRCGVFIVRPSEGLALWRIFLAPRSAERDGRYTGAFVEKVAHVVGYLVVIMNADCTANVGGNDTGRKCEE
jgi:hypothetical protein